MNLIARQLLARQAGHPLRVGIDGICGAGKSTFARELQAVLSEAGRPVVLVDSDGVRKLAARPDTKEAWLKHGAETMSMTPAEFDAYLRAEIDKWAKVAKAANIKLE